MDLTPLHHGGPVERLGHRRVERLRPIDDHQEVSVGAEPATREIGQQPLTDRRILRGPFPEAERVFGPRAIEAQRHHDTVLADVHPSDEQHRQVEVVERRRPPRVQLRLRVGHEASTDRTLTRAPRGDIRTERFETPRIRTSRDADEHLVDNAPVQRVGIRECRAVGNGTSSPSRRTRGRRIATLRPPSTTSLGAWPARYACRAG